MKVNYQWLKEFLDVKSSPQEIGQRLTMAGIEVESVIPADNADGGGDWVLEVAVPPNRGDCLSVLGLAREIAAVTGTAMLPRAENVRRRPQRAPAGIKITIADPQLCPRYSARLISGLRVGPSPSWLRQRLEVCGIRSINNVVDVTNFVMLETGQPLHAFDWDRLPFKRIAVRTANAGQKFATLDGMERELDERDLLICDADSAIALAGVMGGIDTEVSDRTQQVLLESAHFDPMTIRRTAKRLGLHSEASYRFERFVDPEGTVVALERAVGLLAEVAGGEPPGVGADCWPRRRKPQAIFLRDSRLKSLAGADIDRKKSERVLTALGCRIVGRSKSALKVIAPTRRSDLTREADLIEEVIRLSGYDGIPAQLPLVRPRAGRDSRLEWERKIRALLLGLGLTESISLTFTSAELNNAFPGRWDSSSLPVKVLNPLSQEHGELRLSLLSSLVMNLRAHVEQRVPGLGVFEMGKAFAETSAGQHRERLFVSGLCYGAKVQRGLHSDEQRWSFLDVKGVVEGLLEGLGLEGVTWSEDQRATSLHPGKAAWLSKDDSGLGTLGEVHPDLADTLRLPRFTVFELDFEAMVQYARRDFIVHPLPRFPSVERDVALVVRNTFLAEQIIRWAKANGHPLIEDVRIFDEYRGAQVGDGMKSLAYKVSYRAENRTLTDAEVNEIHQALVNKLVENFGARIRQ